MPTDETFPVSVYYRSPEEQESAEEVLKGVAEDQVRLYSGMVEGAATVSALAELQKRGLFVIASPAPRSFGVIRVEAEPAGGVSHEAAIQAPAVAAAEAAAAAPRRLGMRFAARSGPTRAGAPPRLRRAAPPARSLDLRQDPRPTDPAMKGQVDRLEASTKVYRAMHAPQSRDFLLAAAPPAAEAEMYEVQVNAPPQAEWSSHLREIAAVSYYEPPVYRMLLTPEQLHRVEALPFVVRAVRYGLAHSVTNELMNLLAPGSAAPAGQPAAPPARRALRGGTMAAELLGAAPPAAPEAAEAAEGIDTFEVLLHGEQDNATVRRAIEEAGASVVQESPGILRFSAPVNAGLLGALAELPEVRKLTPYRPPTLLADHARKLLGVDAISAGAGPYTGKGELVAIFDSGIDATHPDLMDRIKQTLSYRGAKVDDQVGHGSHVAGIIAGTGAASGGKIRGVAPEAELIVIAMVDANGILLLPPDVGELLAEATKRDARIINLSWGRKFSSDYDFGSYHLDKFIYAHEDVLVVVAAGNSGTVAGGRYVFSSIGTPATAKNALTVGACGTDRQNIPRLWSDPPWQYASPVADFLMCSADAAAVLSSRGPTDYNSVKPDVCACGVYVASARAARGAMTFWDPPFTDYGGRYAYLGGTSMAAPVVSGAAAVLREYLRVKLTLPQPSAALLKAILIAAAHRMPSFSKKSGDPFVAQVGYPDFHQGFGRVDLSTVLPHPAAPPDRRLLCRDVRNGSDAALRAQSPVGSGTATHRYTIVVVAGATDPLRLVLTWTDPPGRSLHNNLQLYVDGPGGIKVGNPYLVYQRDAFQLDALAHSTAPDGVKLGGVPFDKHNNVESVSIQSPAPGDYRIVVLAQYTDPDTPAQGYGLCVCGQLTSDRLEPV